MRGKICNPLLNFHEKSDYNIFHRLFSGNPWPRTLIKMVFDSDSAMSRIFQELEVKGKKLLTLFDTGSDITYVTKDALPKGIHCEKMQERTHHLASETHKITQSCILPIKLDGQDFAIQAFVVNSIGGGGKPIETNRKIDLLFGAVMMEEWDIKLDPKKKKLDISGLEKREFVSF